MSLSPEAHLASWEATSLHFLYRQFFITPPVAPAGTNLSGQTGIVTGSNIGLGVEASRQFLEIGLSTLILAVRDVSKGAAAKQDLESSLSRPDGKPSTNKPNIEVWHLDMASYDSVQDFAVRAASLPRLDFAVLNAAVANVSFEPNSQTGIDQVIQVNYLSTALLALLLLPVLRVRAPTGPGRLVIVGSETASWAAFPQREKHDIIRAFEAQSAFDMTQSYYCSKLLLQLFLVELAQRVGMQDAVVNIVNPGFCYGSGLHRGVDGLLGSTLAIVKRLTGRSTQLGARTLVDAVVVQGPESHGKFLGDGRVRA